MLFTFALLCCLENVWKIYFLPHPCSFSTTLGAETPHCGKRPIMKRQKLPFSHSWRVGICTRISERGRKIFHRMSRVKRLRCGWKNEFVIMKLLQLFIANPILLRHQITLTAHSSQKSISKRSVCYSEHKIS